MQTKRLKGKHKCIVCQRSDSVRIVVTYVPNFSAAMRAECSKCKTISKWLPVTGRECGYYKKIAATKWITLEKQVAKRLMEKD